MNQNWLNYFGISEHEFPQILLAAIYKMLSSTRVVLPFDSSYVEKKWIEKNSFQKFSITILLNFTIPKNIWKMMRFEKNTTSSEELGLCFKTPLNQQKDFIENCRKTYVCPCYRLNG